MSFDFSTLVTDRLQSDVDQRNAKGTYNAADLNRVTAAMEALDEMFRAYGYHSGYTPIFVASRGGQGGLPEGYTRLQYIESSGTQWIDTGFIPNQDTRVVCTFKLLSDNGEHQAIFGARISSSSRQYLFGYAGHKSPPVWRSDYNTTQNNFPSSIPYSGQHNVDKSGNITALDSQTVQATSATFSAGCTLYLFAGDTDGAVGNQSSMQLYGCQVYDDGVLVRDFIPCESPDGAVGLYDAANGMFYGNAGTGTFAAGPELSGNGIPAGYTEAEYLSASGGAAVDLAFRPNQDTEMEIKFATSQASAGGICIADQNWQDTGFGVWCNAAVFGDEIPSKPLWADGQPHVITLSQDGLYQDGGLLWTPPGQTFQVGYNLTAFALNRAGALSEYLTGSIYYIKLYQGGELVREFVPFTDASGAAGFYDRVGHGFYTSAGLTAGPAVPPEPEPDPGPMLDPYTWYESDIPMQSQMAQYLANLAALRGVLSQVAAEPPTPESMALLTYVEANDIEQILLNIEAVLTTIGKSFLRAGMTWAVAGGPEIFARNGGTA